MVHQTRMFYVKNVEQILGTHFIRSCKNGKEIRMQMWNLQERMYNRKRHSQRRCVLRL